VELCGAGFEWPYSPLESTARIVTPLCDGSGESRFLKLNKAMEAPRGGGAMIKVNGTKLSLISSQGRHRSRRVASGVMATATLLGILGLLVLGAVPSGASVITWSGALIIDSTPPALVSLETQQNNTFLSLFTERAGFILPSTLPVDITPSGNFPVRYYGSNDLTPSSIAAGTSVDSYFMKSEPVGNITKTPYGYSATLTFNTPILGLIDASSTLIATDPLVGAIGTTYDLNQSSGLENEDSVELVGPSTIHVSFHTFGDMDVLRVITAATPTTSGSIGVESGGATAVPGYTEVASDGGIFCFGRSFYGSLGGTPLNAPMVGGDQVTGQPGYWTVAADGGVFSFGAAKFYGSMGGQHLNAPIVGMASTPDGLGYWLVAADGGIFTFGDAAYYGSTGGMRLNARIVGMASTPDGLGYWLVAADGGIFAFGDAPYDGSMGGAHLNAPMVAIEPTTGGFGYWTVAADGGVFSFGADAPFLGSMGGQALNKPIVADF
jgi:hypothetical protein